MTKYILVLLCFIVIIIYWFLHRYIVRNNLAIEILQSDQDKFFSRLTKYDLIARYTQSIEDYKYSITNAVISPSLLDKIKIIFCIYKIKRMKIESDWVDNDKFHKMPYSIIMVKDGIYENNYPHTRFRNIIINNTHGENIDQLLSILLHEQLHVYQKTYDIDTLNYVNQYYDKVSIDRTLLRSNPDITEQTYKDKNNLIYSCTYNSLLPKGLNDVTYTPINESRYDHPYEKIVYDLVDKIII